MDSTDLKDIVTQHGAWRIFTVISELVDAVDRLKDKGPCVSIFGSARTPEDSPLYQETIEVAKTVAQNGFNVITGGGPGIMQAANEGTQEGNKLSVGLHIDLPHEQHCNKFVDLRLNFRYFFIRKTIFILYSKAFICMPGGMGTIDELSEAFVLAQTHHLDPVPIILYGKKFWSGFLDWIRNTMIADGYLTNEEVDKFIRVCDSTEELEEILKSLLVSTVNKKAWS
ncbi:MAG: TIGR00730 family Rossman fold protein [Desulfovibrionaceae bacterium]|nr:TIGR00730 family Rossman fold protein [Desulfovibrionaceae bacterium]